MTFEQVAARIEGIPHMPVKHGRIIYDHIRDTRPRAILEIGTAHGVSAAYMGAAVDANGEGRITSVDSDRADYQPAPPDVLNRAGVAHRVDLIRRPDSSYVWLLKEMIVEHSDAAGNCEPVYDFVFIDGAHNFTIDGLATFLVEKLLRPGGWLLLDDLDWSYRDQGAAEGDLNLSASEIHEPHMKAVFDVIVKQHPSFSEFRDQDGTWGWAQKGPDQPRHLTLTQTETPVSLLTRRLRRAAQRLRT